MRTTLSSLRTDRMVVERQRVSYQPPKSVSLVRLLRDAPAENARSEEHGTPEDGCAAARPGSRATKGMSAARYLCAKTAEATEVLQEV